MDTLQKKSIEHAQLTPAKRALLEMRLKGKAPQQVLNQTIGRRPEESGVPLSFAQQRLWFLHQMAPKSTAYNMPTALRLKGVLNASTLAAAFSKVIDRHEILRTTYDELEGKPIAQINPVPQEVLTTIDISS